MDAFNHATNQFFLSSAYRDKWEPWNTGEFAPLIDPIVKHQRVRSFIQELLFRRRVPGTVAVLALPGNSELKVAGCVSRKDVIGGESRGGTVSAEYRTRESGPGGEHFSIFLRAHNDPDATKGERWRSDTESREPLWPVQWTGCIPAVHRLPKGRIHQAPDQMSSSALISQKTHSVGGLVEQTCPTVWSLGT